MRTGRNAPRRACAPDWPPRPKTPRLRQADIRARPPHSSRSCGSAPRTLHRAPPHFTVECSGGCRDEATSGDERTSRPCVPKILLGGVCRVAPAFRPGPSPDPDEEISTIRLFCWIVLRSSPDPHPDLGLREWVLREQLLEALRRHARSLASAVEPLSPCPLHREVESRQRVDVAVHAEVVVVPVSRFAFGPGFGLPCLRPPAPNRAHGSPRFLGHLLRTCRAPRPRRGRRPSRHDAGRRLLPSGITPTPSAPRDIQFSGLTTHGPFARSPTHRRTRCRPASALSPSCPSQGSLPTCLAGFDGAGIAPAR